MLLRPTVIVALLSCVGCASAPPRVAAPSGEEGTCRPLPERSPPKPPAHRPTQGDVGTALLATAAVVTLLAPSPLYYAAKSHTDVTAPELYAVSGAAIAAAGLFIAGGLLKATAHDEEECPPAPVCGETDLTPLFKNPPPRG